MEAPGAWVCTVAMNCARRSMRRRSLELLRQSRPEDPVVEAQFSGPELWGAVRSLPLRQRTAVVLRYVGDFIEVEIGQAMGIARGTVAATRQPRGARSPRSWETSPWMRRVAMPSLSQAGRDLRVELEVPPSSLDVLHRRRRRRMRRGGVRESV